MNKTLIIVAITALCIGLFIGFTWGATTATRYYIKLGMALLEHEGIEIEIDEGMLATGLWQYKNNIGGCLFTDAPLRP